MVTLLLHDCTSGWGRESPPAPFVSRFLVLKGERHFPGEITQSLRINIWPGERDLLRFADSPPHLLPRLHTFARFFGFPFVFFGEAFL